MRRRRRRVSQLHSLQHMLIMLFCFASVTEWALICTEQVRTAVSPETALELMEMFDVADSNELMVMQHP